LLCLDPRMFSPDYYASIMPEELSAFDCYEFLARVTPILKQPRRPITNQEAEKRLVVKSFVENFTSRMD